MTGSASGGCDFPTAERAGLAMLGGEDIITRFRGHPLRGHFWPVQPLDTATEGATDNGLVVMCPVSPNSVRNIAAPAGRCMNEALMLVIDWPGHGRSGHFGRQPLAVHIDSFEIYLEAMDHLLTAAGSPRAMMCSCLVIPWVAIWSGWLGVMPPCAWCHPVCADDSATGHAGCWCAAAGWLPRRLGWRRSSRPFTMFRRFLARQFHRTMCCRDGSQVLRRPSDV